MPFSVLVSCEVDLADLPLEDHAVDVIAAVKMDLEYEVPILFYPGEPAVTNALPENCHPGGCDEWELDNFNVEKLACDIAAPAAPGLSVYELWQFINYIIADINTYTESDHFFDLAIEKGNEAANEEPEPPERDDDDMDWQDHYERLD